jgi:hypothetical protein
MNLLEVQNPMAKLLVFGHIKLLVYNSHIYIYDFIHFFINSKTKVYSCISKLKGLGHKQYTLTLIHLRFINSKNKFYKLYKLVKLLHKELYNSFYKLYTLNKKISLNKPDIVAPASLLKLLVFEVNRIILTIKIDICSRMNRILRIINNLFRICKSYIILKIQKLGIYKAYRWSPPSHVLYFVFNFFIKLNVRNFLSKLQSLNVKSKLILV